MDPRMTPCERDVRMNVTIGDRTFDRITSIDDLAKTAAGDNLDISMARVTSIFIASYTSDTKPNFPKVDDLTVTYDSDKLTVLVARDGEPLTIDDAIRWLHDNHHRMVVRLREAMVPPAYS
jgi:hypothetical protein